MKDEKYARLQQMLLDDGQTWDLSPNDKEAIQYILGVVNFLADELAGYTGTTVPGVLRTAREKVESIQETER